MYCVAAFVIVGTLWGWPAGVESVDCTDSQSVANEVTKCFEQTGVSSLEDADNAIQRNTSAVCGNLNVYRTALPCALKIARNCVVAAGGDPGSLPDPQKVVDGLIYLCDNIGDPTTEYDNQCVIDNQFAIAQCVAGKTSDDESNPCKLFEVSRDCTKSGLVSCRGKTGEILANYLQYNAPAACGACAGGASCLLLLFAALLAMAFRVSDI